MGMRKEFRIENLAPVSIGIRMKFIFRGCLFFILVVLPSAYVHSQDFERQYKTASEFFKEGRYNLAMTAFNPLVTYDKNNPYSEYASFYYALSAHKQNYPILAKDMFIQMKKLYPTWVKMDEVNYWLAMIYFEQHEYFQGLLVLKSIQSPAYQNDIIQMKRHFLVEMEDVETLTMMLEEHPQDAEVGRALARAIYKQPFSQQDRTQLESVIIRFNLNRDDFAQVDVLAPLFKDRYRVSLLFPFLVGNLAPTTVTKNNQFVLDLYNGMRLAKDTLEKQNIHLDLLAYDTERNPSERNHEPLKKILEMDEVKSSDLIVGPLFSDENPTVQEFSEKFKVNMINPVTNRTEFLGKNEFAWLYQPSSEVLGVKSAEYLNERVHNKNCIVLYGDSPEDSVMAFGFIRTALSLGMKVVLAQEFNKETSSVIKPTLATETEFDEFKNPIQFTLKKDSVGSIFVASNEPLIYSKVISAVELRADSAILVGNESWLQDFQDYDKLERLGIVLASPNFTSVFNPDYLRFRKKYIQVFGIVPSNYAKIGYEFTLFIGNMLGKYGVYFQTGFEKEGLIRGSLVKGYNFQQSHSNQLFPF